MKKLDKPKKPLGKPLNWSEQDLADLSQVTPADQKAASALWSNEAPAKFKKLLEANEDKKGNK